MALCVVLRAALRRRVRCERGLTASRRVDNKPSIGCKMCTSLRLKFDNLEILFNENLSIVTWQRTAIHDKKQMQIL